MITKKSYIRFITIFNAHPSHLSQASLGRFQRSYVNDINYRSEFFEEFRELVFPFSEDEKRGQAFQFYTRICKTNTNICTDLPEGKDFIPFEVKQIELAIPPAKQSFSITDYRMGMLSVDVTFQTDDLSKISLALSSMRMFYTQSGQPKEFSTLLTQPEYLGFEFMDPKSKRFSGPKFKLYLVHDVDHEITPEFSGLVYDVASCSEVGGSNPVHPDYLSSVENHYIRLFNNYESLALTDSFTIMGKGTLNERFDLLWREEIFRIYLYILFLRYNIGLYNTIWRDEEDLSKITNKFADFTDYYCFQNISYNFMSELYYDRLKSLLNVDADLLFFRDRLQRLSDREQRESVEYQTKIESNQNLLISSFGVLIAPVTVFSGLFGMNIFKEPDPKELGFEMNFGDVISYSLISAFILVVILFSVKSYQNPEGYILKLWRKSRGKLSN